MKKPRKSKAWRARVVKRLPEAELFRWRGHERSRAVLTVTGQLWLSTGDGRWKQKPGRGRRKAHAPWPVAAVELWAAAAGYVRVSTQGEAYTSVRRSMTRHGDHGGTQMTMGSSFPDEGAAVVRRVRRTKAAAEGFGPRSALGPVVPEYAAFDGDRVRELGRTPAAAAVFSAAEQDARLAYYAARAAAKLPLDGVPAAAFRGAA